MPSQSLLFYEMSVNKSGEPGDLDLTNFDGNNMLEVLEEFLQLRCNNNYGNKKTKQALGAEYIDKDSNQLYIRDGQYLKGYISKGAFGNRAPIRDVIANEDSYTKKLSDAEMIPLYFCTRIRSGYTRAILILQTFGNQSAKSLLAESLRSFFSKYYSGYTLKLNTIVPNNLLDQFIDQGAIKKFRFIRYSIPDDITYISDNGEKFDRKAGEAELTLKLKDARLFPSWRSDLKKSLRSTKLEFINIPNFEYNKAKVELIVNGKPKIIDLGKEDKIAPRLDITDDVVDGANGFPTFESIDAVATEFLDELTNKL